MNKIQFRSIILLTFLILIMSACVGAGESLDGTSWTLESYRDGSGERVDVLPRSTTTALFQATQVTGSAGCNNYSATYEVDGNRLSFDPPTTTRRNCSSPAGIMIQENDFLNALSATARYTIERDSLEMKDGRGETLLVFRRSTGN